jgi:hypothetical protein
MDKPFVEQRAADLTSYINNGILFDRNCRDSDIWWKFVIPVRVHRRFLFFTHIFRAVNKKIYRKKSRHQLL